MALVGLDNFNGEWPPYASHLIMELWEETSTGKYFVTSQVIKKKKIIFLLFYYF